MVKISIQIFRLTFVGSYYYYCYCYCLPFVVVSTVSSILLNVEYMLTCCYCFSLVSLFLLSAPHEYLLFHRWPKFYVFFVVFYVGKKISFCIVCNSLRATIECITFEREITFIVRFGT